MKKVQKDTPVNMFDLFSKFADIADEVEVNEVRVDNWYTQDASLAATMVTDNEEDGCIETFIPLMSFPSAKFVEGKWNIKDLKGKVCKITFWKNGKLLRKV